MSAIAAIALSGGFALAQGGTKPKTPAPALPVVPPVAAGVADPDVVHYCGNLAPTAAQARLAYQTKKLMELESRIKQQLDALEAEEARAREWVAKRDTLMKAASEDVVAIYAKMSAEAGAAQIATMDDPVAAGILSKLNPRVAGAILGEMDADRAAKLTSLMTGSGPEDNKS
jgi:flagellar motility protein MotE (MotC chaperone)